MSFLQNVEKKIKECGHTVLVKIRNDTDINSKMLHFRDT